MRVADGIRLRGSNGARDAGEGAGAGDHADLRRAGVAAGAVRSGRGPLELETDQDPLRGGLAPQQRVPTAEVVLLGLQRDGEPDAGLERVDLVAELVAGEDQAGFDPQDVQGIEAEGGQPVWRARLPGHVPERRLVAGV